MGPKEKAVHDHASRFVGVLERLKRQIENNDSPVDLIETVKLIRGHERRLAKSVVELRIEELLSDPSLTSDTGKRDMYARIMSELVKDYYSAFT